MLGAFHPPKAGIFMQKMNCSSVIPIYRKQHRQHFVPCVNGFICQIPLSSGRVYIGQATGASITGQGNITILRALARLAILQFSVIQSKCKPDFNYQHSGEFRDQEAREIHEEFWILKMSNQCISSPSPSLYYNVAVNDIKRYSSHETESSPVL